MNEFAAKSLRKIAKGTLATSLGLSASLALTFLGQVIVARYVTVSEYGLFSLSLAVLTGVAAISTLGLQQGTPRYIAFFRAKGKRSKVRSVIALSIQFALMASVPLSLLVFFAAGPIATNVFHSPELAFPLKIFSIGIPFLALIRVITSAYRGFDRIDAKVYFDDLARTALFPLLLGVVILCGLSFRGVIFAYPLSLALALVALIVYSLKKAPLHLRSLKSEWGNSASIRKELLFFCLPILATLMLAMARSYSSLVLVGFFKTPLLAGLYNAASPLAEFMLITSTAVGLIYIPVMSGLYAREMMAEFRRNYTVLAKWIMAASLPLFLVLALFPETVLNFVFGAAYIPAASALRILGAGFFVANFLSLASFSLVVVGKPKLVMWALLAAAVVGIALGIAFIPPLGLVGAAIASAVSIVVAEIFCSVALYRLTGAQPFSRNLLKPFVVALALIAVVYFVATILFNITFWMLPVLFAVFCLAYALAVFLTKSFDREDAALFSLVKSRLGRGEPK